MIPEAGSRQLGGFPGHPPQEQQAPTARLRHLGPARRNGMACDAISRAEAVTQISLPIVSDF